MFRLSNSLDTWSYAARGALTILALLALVPSVIVATLGAAFTLLPVVVLVLPFVMAAMMHKRARQRLGHPPTIHTGGMLAPTAHLTTA
jgi:hypothetical protein